MDTFPEITDRTLRTAEAHARVRGLLEEGKVRTPPVDVDALAPLVGVSEIKSVQLDGPEACLLPTRNGFTILVNAKVGERRRRFSIAHEIAHVLLNPDSPKHRSRLGVMETSEEEQLCNAMAAELLMPTSVFESEMKECAPSISWIVELAKRYETAIEASALRFAELTAHSLEIVCWDPQGNCLSPRWVSGTEIARSWWPGGIPTLQLDETLFGPVRAFHSKNVVLSTEKPQLEWRPLRFESKRFGRRRSPHVLSIIYGFAKSQTTMEASRKEPAR